MKNSQVEKHFKILVGILELTKYLTTSKKTQARPYFDKTRN